MQELTWLETHLETIENALEVINKFRWDISVLEAEGKWYVLTGTTEKHVLLKADTRESVDAFLYGMGLGYVGIPDPYFEKLVEDINEWYDKIT